MGNSGAWRAAARRGLAAGPDAASRLGRPSPMCSRAERPSSRSRQSAPFSRTGARPAEAYRSFPQSVSPEGARRRRGSGGVRTCCPMNATIVRSAEPAAISAGGVTPIANPSGGRDGFKVGEPLKPSRRPAPPRLLAAPQGVIGAQGADNARAGYFPILSFPVLRSGLWARVIACARRTRRRCYPPLGPSDTRRTCPRRPMDAGGRKRRCRRTVRPRLPSS